MKFYLDQLKYSIDEISPSQCDDEYEYDYEILSKPLFKK